MRATTQVPKLPPKELTPRGEEEEKEPGYPADTDLCAICLEPPKCPMELPCGHSFCVGCVDTLRETCRASMHSCPLCRAPLPPGRAELFNEAAQIYVEVERQIAPQGTVGSWNALTPELQEQMSKVVDMWEKAADKGHSNAQ